MSALGLDETLFARTGRWRTQHWCTSIVDVARPSQLLDVVPGRTAAGPSAWIEAQPKAWRAGVAWGVLDLSGPYRKTFTDTLPHAGQVADPFHVVKLANSKLDECRRRVQNETLGHRGHRDDPLYRSRRLLTKAHERLNTRGEAKLLGLLQAGDPRGEVRFAWHAKETIRGIYAIDGPTRPMPSSPSSLRTSSTVTTRSRSARWAGPCAAGTTHRRLAPIAGACWGRDVAQQDLDRLGPIARRIRPTRRRAIEDRMARFDAEIVRHDTMLADLDRRLEAHAPVVAARSTWERQHGGELQQLDDLDRHIELIERLDQVATRNRDLRVDRSLGVELGL